MLTTTSRSHDYGCGCRDQQPHGGFGPAGGFPGWPINLNINNNANPFMGSYAPHMEPVVNTPPIVIAPQQQQQAVAPPQNVIGRGRTTVVEAPTVTKRETEIVRLQPQIFREEPTRRIEREDPQVFIRPPANVKKFQFRKHNVPTWY